MSCFTIYDPCLSCVIFARISENEKRWPALVDLPQSLQTNFQAKCESSQALRLTMFLIPPNPISSLSIPRSLLSSPHPVPQMLITFAIGPR